MILLIISALSILFGIQDSTFVNEQCHQAAIINRKVDILAQNLRQLTCVPFGKLLVEIPINQPSDTRKCTNILYGLKELLNKYEWASNNLKSRLLPKITHFVDLKCNGRKYLKINPKQWTQSLDTSLNVLKILQDSCFGTK